MLDGVSTLGRSILLSRDHDWYGGCLGVGDGLDSLGHHTVVGGNNQYDDIGDAMASGTHRGKRLVTGRVDERDRTAAPIDLVTRRCAG